MKKLLKLIFAVLASIGLLACQSTGPAVQYPVYGTVLRVIDANAATGPLEPCLASRLDQIQAGKTFVAIRYRHWASHFVSTVYAEVPTGMRLQVQQRLEIEPAHCSRNELAIIVGNVG